MGFPRPAMVPGVPGSHRNPSIHHGLGGLRFSPGQVFEHTRPRRFRLGWEMFWLLLSTLASLGTPQIGAKSSQGGWVGWYFSPVKAMYVRPMKHGMTWHFFGFGEFLELSRLICNEPKKGNHRPLFATGMLGRQSSNRIATVFCWFLFAWISIWGFPKMVGFPNKPMGFPTKNCHFGGITILGNPIW